MDYLFRRALSIALTICLALMPSFGWGLQIKLNKNYNIRSSQITDVMGSLKAGSIIEIPNQYAVNKDKRPLFNEKGERIHAGEVDFELTLNNWIDKGATLQAVAKPRLSTFGYRASGTAKKDWFFPVKIVNRATGSSFNPEKVGDNQTTWIALDHIRRNKNGIVLASDAEVQAEPTPQATAVAGTPASPPENIYLRTNEQVQAAVVSDTNGAHMGFLTSVDKGSVLELNGNYAVRDGNNTVNLPATLDNWISNGNAEPTTAGAYTDVDGREMLFIPARVVHYEGPGPDLVEENADRLHVNLGGFTNKSSYTVIDEPLARQIVPDDSNKSEETRVSSPTNAGDQTSTPPVSANPTQETTIETSNDADDAETEAKTLCVKCDIPEPLAEMVSYLPNTLRALATKIEANSKNVRSFTKSYEDKLKKTCGFAWSHFESYMQQELTAKGLEYDLMFKLMLHESVGGNCNAKLSEGNNSESIGLFQINTGSTKKRGCTRSQKQQIRDSGGDIDWLKAGPNCLENPVISLQESIRLMKEKEKSLFDNGPFDIKQVSKKDKMRLLLSAYNGGQGWTKRAASDLKKFNEFQARKNSNFEPLDHNKWRDLRLFFFRKALNHKEQMSVYGGYNGSGRKNGLSITNVAYVESLIPRTEDEYQ